MLTKKGLLYVSHTLSVFSTGYNLEQMLDGPVVYSGQHIVASCGDSVDLKGQFAWGPPPSHTHTHTPIEVSTHTFLICFSCSFLLGSALQLNGHSRINCKHPSHFTWRIQWQRYFYHYPHILPHTYTCTCCPPYPREIRRFFIHLI